MKEKNVYPVSVGNVTYLSGMPTQNALKDICSELYNEEKLEKEKQLFAAALAERGIVAKIDVCFCMGLRDLLENGCSLLPAWIPRDGEREILWLDGFEGRGYWCELDEKVLLFSPEN